MKTNPNYVKIHLDKNKMFKTFSPERIERIRTFLNSPATIDIYSEAFRFNPEYIDSRVEFTSTKAEAVIFKKWFQSLLFTKLLIEYEDNLVKHGNGDAFKINKNRCFLLDYVQRLKNIYFRIESYSAQNQVIYINDATDIKCLYLFFRQIDEYLKYDIGQNRPMDKNELNELLVNYFEENLSDVSTITGIEDLTQLFTEIEILQYVFGHDNTSVIPNRQTNLFFYDFIFLSGQTQQQIYDELDEDECHEFSEDLGQWTTDPMLYKYSGLVDFAF